MAKVRSEGNFDGAGAGNLGVVGDGFEGGLGDDKLLARTDESGVAHAKDFRGAAAESNVFRSYLMQIGNGANGARVEIVRVATSNCFGTSDRGDGARRRAVRIFVGVDEDGIGAGEPFEAAAGDALNEFRRKISAGK